MCLSLYAYENEINTGTAWYLGGYQRSEMLEPVGRSAGDARCDRQAAHFPPPQLKHMGIVRGPESNIVGHHHLCVLM